MRHHLVMLQVVALALLVLPGARRPLVRRLRKRTLAPPAAPGV
ncbi:MAG TPA: hypothetical protein VNA20_10910 [Frankiaceae bacterium]|nr:hypothetical protein [Frankiaceae bacterium]